MIEVDVPGWKSLRLLSLVLDVNGVLTLDDDLLLGLEARFKDLRSRVDIHLLSADTHGSLHQIAASLEVDATRLREGGRRRSRKRSCASWGAPAWPRSATVPTTSRC